MQMFNIKNIVNWTGLFWDWTWAGLGFDLDPGLDNIYDNQLDTHPVFDEIVKLYRHLSSKTE